MTLLDSRSDAVSTTTVAYQPFPLLTDDPSLAMRSAVTDEFSNHANECYLIQNRTAAKFYILRSHMAQFNILVLMIYRL